MATDLPVLQIDLNTIRLRINNTQDVIEFNANDILFIEGFYNMIALFQQKQVEYQKRLDEISTSNENGNTGETIQAMKEICLFARDQIDEIFGKSSSQKLFGNVLAFEPIEQFFTGIAPHIKKVRAKHIKEFLPPQPRRRKRKK